VNGRKAEHLPSRVSPALSPSFLFSEIHFAF